MRIVSQVLALALLLALLPAHAQVTIGQNGGRGEDPPTIKSVGPFALTGNLALVAITVGDGTVRASTAVPSWNTTETFTLVSGSAVTDANGFCSTAWFKLNNPTNTTASITYTLGAASQAAIHYVTLGNASLTLGTPSTNTATTANPSVTVANSANGDTVVAAVCSDSAAAAMTEANTLIFEAEDVGGDTDHSSQYKTATGANTVMAWTNSDSGSGHAESGLAISPSGGAVSIVPKVMQQIAANDDEFGLALRVANLR